MDSGATIPKEPIRRADDPEVSARRNPFKKHHHRHRDAGLVLIAIFKFVKGAALIAAGILIITLVHKDIPATLFRWVDAIGLDANNEHVQHIVHRMDRVSHGNLIWAIVGTFAYAALFLVEGTGLFMGKRWGEYLSLTATISFIPFEIFEIFKHTTLVKIAFLVGNILVVIYLIWKIRQQNKIHRERERAYLEEQRLESMI